MSAYGCGVVDSGGVGGVIFFGENQPRYLPVTHPRTQFPTIVGQDCDGVVIEAEDEPRFSTKTVG